MRTFEVVGRNVLYICARFLVFDFKEKKGELDIIKDRERFVRVWNGCKFLYLLTFFRRYFLRFGKENLSLLCVYYEEDWRSLYVFEAVASERLKEIVCVSSYILLSSSIEKKNLSLLCVYYRRGLKKFVHVWSGCKWTFEGNCLYIFLHSFVDIFFDLERRTCFCYAYIIEEDWRSLYVFEVIHSLFLYRFFLFDLKRTKFAENENVCTGVNLKKSNW